MAKNVALISFDDLFNVIRFKDAYGEPISIPNIERLAAMGTYFDSAHAICPVCNPSRTATLTGQSPFRTGIESNEQDFFRSVDPSLTLPFLFKEAGYTTATVGKLFHGGIITDRQQDGYRADYLQQLFDVVHPSMGLGKGAGEGVRPAPFPGSDFADHKAARWAANFIESEHEQPWFLTLGFLKPHRPWFVPERFFNLYDRSNIVLPNNPSDDVDDLPLFFRQFINTRRHERVLEEGTWQDRIVGYMASISFVDAQLGVFLDAMDRTGAWEDTTLVLWSDHGHHLGDKQQWGKFTHWEQATNAPLIVVDPDVGRPGRVVNTPVSLLDLFPTLVDLAGLDDPLARDGHSLRPLLRDPGAHWDHFAGSILQGSVSLRTEQFRYIASIDGSEQLYDMVRDPDQFENLAGLRRYRDVLDRLHDRMAEDIEALGGRIDLHARRVDGASAPETILVSPDLKIAAGRGGDDIYLAIDPDAIVERENRGFDTLTLFAPADGVPVRARVPAGIERTELAENAGGHVRGRSGDDVIVGGDFADRLAGRGGADTLLGGARGDDLDGGRGRDLLAGGDGRDRLDGDRGSDDLRGGHGRDRLRGRAGDDALAGGLGDDRLSGGGGDDRFVFGARDGSDAIVNFRPGRDLVDLSALRLDAMNEVGRLHTSEGWAVAEVADKHVWIVFRGLRWSELSADDFLI